MNYRNAYLCSYPKLFWWHEEFEEQILWGMEDPSPENHHQSADPSLVLHTSQRMNRNG